MGRKESNFMTLGTLKSKNLFMKQIMSALDYISSSDVNVIIVGESGTGKNTVAETIHSLSPLSHIPMEVISCRNATGNDLHLNPETVTYVDEVHFLGRLLQNKLLKCMKETPGARIIASTDSRIGPMMDNGKFRVALYMELAGMRIGMPRLYQRQEDIPSIVRDALKKANKKYMKKVKLTARAMKPLIHYRYKGNITELYSIIDRAVLMAQDDTIKLNSILSIMDMDSLSLISLTDCSSLSYGAAMARFEKELLSGALTDGGSAARAATILQMDESMFAERCRIQGVDMPENE